MTRSTRFSMTVFALGVTITSSATAQALRVHGVAAATPVARVEMPAAVYLHATPEAKPGPTTERASIGVKVVRAPEAGRPKPAPIPADSSRNRAMMIVGGTAFIAGAVIGGSNGTVGTIVMLGGAGIGLWGLYRYLE